MVFIDSVLASVWEMLRGVPWQWYVALAAGLGAAALVAGLLIRACSFRLILHLGGGKTVCERHPGDHKLELVSPPPRKGYRFIGWFRDEACTEPVTGVLRVPRRGAELYARWKAVLPVDTSHVGVPRQTFPETHPADQSEARPVAVCTPFQSSSALSPEEDDGDFTRALLTSASGELIFIRRRRSFLARMALVDSAVQGYFGEVRAALLSRKGVRERVGWGGASYMAGRAVLARVTANTKSLVVFFALDPREALQSGVRFTDMSERKRYAAVPVRCKVTGQRTLRSVLVLIQRLADSRGLATGGRPAAFDFPPADSQILAARGLIKISARKENGEAVSGEELHALLSAGATLEKFSSSFWLRRMGRKAARGLLGDSIVLPDFHETVGRSSAARALINLDTIAAHFAEGEHVDLESLREKGLVDRRATECKVLARGRLDKALTVEAEEFSLAAERLIALTGGKVVRVHRNK